MNRSVRSLRLYLASREMAILVPIYAETAMAAICILVALVVGIAVGLPLPADVQEGFANNSGPIWAVAGFFVGQGGIAVSRNFAMALAFGSTRRDFWLGTSLGFLISAVVAAAIATVLLGVELVTDHWFIGVRAFDVYVLGSGNPVLTFLIMLALSLACMFAGAFFGTLYRAFGVRVAVSVGVLLALVLLGVVALAVWQSAVVLPALSDLGYWSVVLLLTVATALLATGSYAANRRATL